MSEARFHELSRSRVFFKDDFNLWVFPENEEPGNEGWIYLGNIGEIWGWARGDDPMPEVCENISEMIESDLGELLDEFEELSEEISHGR